MSKEKRVAAHVINIKLMSENRGPQRYAEMLKNVRGVIQKTSSDTAYMIRTVFESEIAGEKILQGKLSRFLVISGETPWLDEVTNEPIPNFIFDETKHPNLREVEYIFFPKRHRFVYFLESGIYFSTKTIKKFLENALQHAIHQTEDVIVDIELRVDEIERILNAKELASLHIEINMSNPDLEDDAADWVREQFENSKIGKLTTDILPLKEGRIDTSSDFIQGMLKFSKSNGTVKAVLLENGKKEKIETKDYPLKITGRIPKDEDKYSYIYRVISNMFIPRTNE